MRKEWILALGWPLLVLAVCSNMQQRQQVVFLEQARKIDNDQVQDLMYQLQVLGRGAEGDKTRAYLAGFTDAQNKPDLSAIWHSGYDRGTAVAQESQAAAEAAEKLVQLQRERE